MTSDSRRPGDGSDPRPPLDGSPASRRSTHRTNAVQGPASRPAGNESESYGRIHRMVAWIDANKGAFAIARLISQTGVNLRSFLADTRDDPRVISKLWPILDVQLTPEERDALLKALREG